MQYGSLNQYFQGFGAKRLSEVEVSPELSHQHELNGIGDFKTIFGADKRNFTAKYFYLADDEERVITSSGLLTWYDARENHPSRSEFRLYYTDNEAMSESRPGDLIVVAKNSDTELLILIAPSNKTSEKQLLWLFGLGEVASKFIVWDLFAHPVEIGFAGNLILSAIGIEPVDTADDYLEEMIRKFGRNFPKTKEFSDFARAQLNSDINPSTDPDQLLVAWLGFEEKLFRTLEKEIVQAKLKEGFGSDGINVDDFVNFSLSVQNRRKSRAGHAFENHVAALLDLNGLRYSKGARTERNNRPDFIFPEISFYNDLMVPAEKLTMLGVKTTAKDRWRQVLSEADRIETKHLITLQPAISENQTDEMRAQKIQLVVPAPILPTYSAKQQVELVSVKQFLDMIRSKQDK